MKNNRDALTAVIILAITALTVYLLPLIPGFLRDVRPGDMVGFQPQFILVFLIFDILLIGIFAGVHKLYVKDYSKIRNVWFFALFGGIMGGLLGEVALGASLLLLIPYTVLMFLYAQLYKRFAWWKVALTSYLGGIFVENIINRSPIQIPTLIWIAFFTYPYFATKIWENRKKIKLKTILYDFKGAILGAIVLLSLVIYLGIKTNISPPLIFLAATLPFAVVAAYKLMKK